MAEHSLRNASRAKSESLELVNKGLTELNNKIDDLTLIEKIDISENSFKSIPHQFQKLNKLKIFKCSNNLISIVDKSNVEILEEEIEFFKPKNDKKLLLNNPEDSIYSDEEDGKDGTSDSTSFDSGIHLSEKLFDFSKLESLLHLDLSHNNIDSLPQSLFSLPSLEHLDLSHNKIATLHPVFQSATKLKFLNISWNQLFDLPLWITKLVRCVRMYFSGNPVGNRLDLPADFGFVCRRIKYLELENTSMNVFPESLAFLLDLRHLKLSNLDSEQVKTKSKPRFKYFDRTETIQTTGQNRNLLWSVPDCIVNLRGLCKLEIRDASLSFLPDNFGDLKNLIILDISSNNLKWLPESLVNLTNLRFLDMSRNLLVMLPLGVERMSSLQHLMASRNSMIEIQDGLGKLTTNGTLETLDLYQNEIISISCLSKGGLKRCDLAGNKVGLDQANQIFDQYLLIQNEFRMWTGEWELSSVEDHNVNVSEFKGRLQMQEKSSSSDIVKDETEEDGDWTLHNNTIDLMYENCEDEVLENCADVEDVKIKDDMVEDDWSVDCEPYEKLSKVEYNYNLQRMDTENWWGSGQFCPADQHAAPVHSVNVTAGERSKFTYRQGVGRTQGQSHETHVFDVDQFDDAE